MPLSIEFQAIIIVSSIIAGFAIGLIFDIYRIIRGVGVPKIVVVIEDILFWTLTALVLFVFLLYIDYAFLSPYVYIFIGLTFLFYLTFISKFIIKVEAQIIEKIYRILRIFLKTLLYPIKIMYYFICGKKQYK